MLRRVEGWVVDKFYGGRVVKDVVLCCLGQDLLEDLMRFMEDQSERFASSLDGLAPGEHSLEGSAIHDEYVHLIEARLAAPLKRHGKTVQEFFGICSKIQEAGHDEEIQPFLKVILAASDFLLFADIMRDLDKRNYFFIILRGLQRQFKAKLADSEGPPGSAGAEKSSSGHKGEGKRK